MPTLFTDPRSGGVKKSSGVNVLPIVAETWGEVRDDLNKDVDWLIAGFNTEGKTCRDITILKKGKGGLSGCSSELPHSLACFGGCRLRSGRFVTFFYADESTPTMQKGRASMYKNGVLNVLEGSDCEVEMRPGLSEDDTIPKISGGLDPPPKNVPATQTKSAPVKKASSAAMKPVSQKKLTSKAAGDKVEESEDVVPTSTVDQLETGDPIPYALLKDVHDPADLPSWVDPLRREEALSEEEFSRVFGMDRKDFLSLPAWKRTRQKKELGLF